ncbi:MAG: SpoIID/LytB domain-containing protein [Lachnospiraceae bacterium]
MKKISRLITFIVCLPLIGTVFVKPDKGAWKTEERDEAGIDERFVIRIGEDIGNFVFQPEQLTQFLMYKAIPEDMTFSSSEDYIAGADTVRDPEQEYLKALAIVCRSNLVAVWEAEQCPEVLDYEKMRFTANYFYRIYTEAASDSDAFVKLNEIQRAVEAVEGAVITKDGSVIAAPFFTTSPAGMLVSEAGDQVGFSLNYAYVLAAQGLDFYEILKYFYGDIRVNIYE